MTTDIFFDALLAKVITQADVPASKRSQSWLRAQLESLEGIEDILEKACASGFEVKAFAITELQDTEVPFLISGPDWVWQFVPIKAYSEPLPLKALRALSWARNHGLPSQGYWIGEPLTVSQGKPQADLLFSAAEGLQRAGRAAWGAGRRVAPALGAGLSVAAGSAAIAGAGMAAATYIPAAITAALLTDPVLVAQIPQGRGAVLLELTRWV